MAWVVLTVLAVFVWCLYMEIEALKYLYGQLEREMADIELSQDLPEQEPIVLPSKKGTTIYIPGRDPMAEFKGGMDDWYGDQKDE